MDIVLGAQFGDEGKGRIVNHLCASGKYKVCARFNGSDNAGHTAVLDSGKKIAFRQIPVGAAYGMTCIIGRGCVLDLDNLEAEIKAILKIRKDWTLYVDSRCHIKTQAHRDRDASEEQGRDKPIGTTLSGNGPAYADKHARVNQRICDVDINIYPNIKRKAMIVDTSLLDYSRCLVEGAHGIMLDIDSGTYPFVTSSACTAAAACHSLGVSPKIVNRIIGVAKPYLTRVGAGSLVTEISEETTKSIIRERGREFGTNTKRPRRIGWLDLSALAYAVRVSGIIELALCKVDILSYLDNIAVCTGYKGIAFGYVPAKNEEYQAVEPIYEYIKWDGLGLKRVVNLIEKFIEVPVTIISSGTGMSDILIR